VENNSGKTGFCGTPCKTHADVNKQVFKRKTTSINCIDCSIVPIKKLLVLKHMSLSVVCMMSKE
jgi:hypothetical protein